MPTWAICDLYNINMCMYINDLPFTYKMGNDKPS